MNNEPFVIERTFDAPVSQVWKAITDKDEMKQWYFDLEEFNPEVGFEFSFSGEGHKGEKYLHHCKITEVVKERKLRYSWSYEGHEGMSYVSFELFPDNGKTKFRLTHEGLESFPQNNPDFAKESFTAGWTEIISKTLKEYLEK